jgi:hypothetical protein
METIMFFHPISLAQPGKHLELIFTLNDDMQQTFIARRRQFIIFRIVSRGQNN